MDTSAMKKQICYLAMLLMPHLILINSAYSQNWGPTNDSVQMSIGVKNSENPIKTNQPVLLSISFRNLSSDEAFRIYRANGIEYDPGYTWSVISPSGRDISPRMKTIPSSESGVHLPLLPNGTNEFAFNMSYLCKFAERGTYKITGRKWIYSLRLKKPIEVVSNPLFVRITTDQ